MASRMTDDDLMARLRALGSQVDPVPDDVVMAGRSALAYQDLDVRLAELVEDSAMLGTGMRSDAEGSWFTFEVDNLLIEFTVHTRGGEMHLVGHVDGGQVADMRVVQGSSTESRPVDEVGRFSSSVEAGPLRVELSLADGLEVATSWILASPT